MRNIWKCDICGGYSRVETEVRYAVKARRYIADWWTGGIWKKVDICDPCIDEIKIMRNKSL
jgi:hypothetical protein